VAERDTQSYLRHIQSLILPRSRACIARGRRLCRQSLALEADATTRLGLRIEDAAPSLPPPTRRG
jgi:hypothetical protein